MKKTIYFLAALLISIHGFAALPVLKPVGDKWLLHVDDKPFVMLGGQVMNSSSFDLNWMESVWPRMKAFHLNTVIAPISWQAVEPEEGQFDFSLVDGLVQQARQADIKLVLLWFGSWKNGNSGSVPGWVISDMNRFPRMERENGYKVEVLSNLSKETCVADGNAFAAFMRHLKAIDEKENTVLMVQVQNEVGLLGDSRDRSPAAQQAFAQAVPETLMQYMVQHKEQLKPHLKQVWEQQGSQTAGTWSDVFGTGVEADEIFMAWHYASYIDRMAAAGKAEYNLPLIANAWLGKDGVPGKYPSGGPVARMMDVWKAGAPHIDLLAADIYGYFSDRCQAFTRQDNPLFVPEACALWLGDRWSAPAKAFYTIAEAQAIGFGPFGIDHAHYQDDHPVGVAYRALTDLMPLIVQQFGTDNLRGFFKENNETDTTISFGDVACQIHYASELEDCYGLIVRVADDEFIVAGNGAHVRFVSNDETRPGVSVCQLEEGTIGPDGEWQRTRLLLGDEALGQGTSGVKLPPLAYGLMHDKNNMSIQRIKLYLHPAAANGPAIQGADDGMPAEGVFN